MKLSLINLLMRLFVGIILLSIPLYAGQTGKLAVKITDRDNNEAVIGANVIIEGTYLGAAADIDGYYYINNIPPGEYTVSFSAVGYRKTTVREVKITIDKTTNFDVEFKENQVVIDCWRVIAKDTVPGKYIAIGVSR